MYKPIVYWYLPNQSELKHMKYGRNEVNSAFLEDVQQIAPKTMYFANCNGKILTHWSKHINVEHLERIEFEMCPLSESLLLFWKVPMIQLINVDVNDDELFQVIQATKMNPLQNVQFIHTNWNHSHLLLPKATNMHAAHVSLELMDKRDAQRLVMVLGRVECTWKSFEAIVCDVNTVYELCQVFRFENTHVGQLEYIQVKCSNTMKCTDEMIQAHLFTGWIHSSSKIQCRFPDTFNSDNYCSFVPQCESKSWPVRLLALKPTSKHAVLFQYWVDAETNGISPVCISDSVFQQMRDGNELRRYLERQVSV
jgi:hypothetical protein